MNNNFEFMSIQDDARENEQIELFGLSRLEGENRGGIDAIMTLDNGTELPFELKTTTNGSVTTVRDFGYDHIKKWENKHWLISKYSTDGSEIEYTLYGSPAAMSSWIKSKEEYIKPDFDLANLAPNKLTLEDLFAIVSEKEKYSLEDARKLNKRQNTVKEYEDLMDEENGYSQERMLEILKNRCKYLIERGSTLNNPHIPASYFQGWEQITENHASKLKELVNQALST